MPTDARSSHTPRWAAIVRQVDIGLSRLSDGISAVGDGVEDIREAWGAVASIAESVPSVAGEPVPSERASSIDEVPEGAEMSEIDRRHARVLLHRQGIGVRGKKK